MENDAIKLIDIRRERKRVQTRKKKPPLKLFFIRVRRFWKEWGVSLDELMGIICALFFIIFALYITGIFQVVFI